MGGTRRRRREEPHRVVFFLILCTRTRWRLLAAAGITRREPHLQEILQVLWLGPPGGMKNTHGR